MDEIFTRTKKSGSLDVVMDLQSAETLEEINRVRAENAQKKNTMLRDTLTGVEVPADKLAEIQAFAAKLHKKYPNWKPGRVASHTAAFFRLKLKK